MIQRYNSEMSLPCIVTALESESRAFIQHFNMRARETNGLRTYISNDCILLQTGIGKLNSAANVAALLQSDVKVNGIVNIGIAGACAPLGTQLIAHCVKDAGSGKLWYPHLPPSRSLPVAQSVTVQTHDKPELKYIDGVAYDMEAAGIFSAARGKLDSCAVQSVKVISDNPDSSTSQITKELVHQWMESSIEIVETLIQSFNDPTAAAVQTVENFVSSLQDTLHFTATQSHQLHRLTTQYLTLRECLPTLRSEDINAKTLLKRLNDEVAAVNVRY